jgi:hypothetical protein
MTQVLEYLPNKCREALSLTPSTATDQEKKRNTMRAAYVI